MNSKNIHLKVIIGIFIFMILFFKDSNANYKKVFFDHSITSIEGVEINLKKYHGKAILLINVASYCGFTKQYNDMQKLWEIYKNKGLVVLGVPSNSFNQEKKDSGEIKKFCETNFNISFPMTSIYDVKGNNAHEIYKWAKQNYGRSAIPKWNFHKILINKNGKIENTFAPFTNPMSKKIINQIEKILN